MSSTDVVALGLVQPDHQTAARAVRLGPRPGGRATVNSILLR